MLPPSKEQITALLSGGDVRSISGANEVVALISSQELFDTLFSLLLSNDRLIAMRAADAIEKVSKTKPEWLQSHKQTLLRSSSTRKHIELGWHLAQLLSRLAWNDRELPQIWQLLHQWVVNPNESKIVRANALESLALISLKYNYERANLHIILKGLSDEAIPSLRARVRKVCKMTGIHIQTDRADT